MRTDRLAYLTADSDAQIWPVLPACSNLQIRLRGIGKPREFELNLGENVGNLIALEEGLWSQTPSGIQAFSSGTLERAEIDRKLKGDPTNLNYLLRRARFSFERGDLSAANADLRQIPRAASEEQIKQIQALRNEILTRMLTKDFATAAELAEAMRQRRAQ